MLSNEQLKRRKPFCMDVQAGLRFCWSHPTYNFNEIEATPPRSVVVYLSDCRYVSTADPGVAS